MSQETNFITIFHGFLGIIFVFDVGKEESFEAVQWWWEFAETYAPHNTVKVLVGNKTDLAKDRVIPGTRGEVSLVH